MSIVGVGNTQDLLNALGLGDASSSGASSSDTSLNDDPYNVLESKDSSAASISTAASVLSSLSSLQKTNNTEFKAVASEIATSLHNAASDSSSSLESYELEKLAAQFSNAATTGSLSSLSTSSGQSGSLKGYSSSSGGLLSTYLATSSDSSVFSTVNSIVSSKLNSALTAE